MFCVSSLLLSYDNTVRLFDARKLSNPVASADVGGGAWRVKWHPSSSRKHDLLVACMHDGFKVVRFNLCLQGCDLFSGGEARILRKYDGHKSLAYGVDWCHTPSSGETVVGCCSFYDHKMSLWSA
jgi:diphthamide biosynthesis protein 7